MSVPFEILRNKKKLLTASENKMVEQDWSKYLQFFCLFCFTYILQFQCNATPTSHHIQSLRMLDKVLHSDSNFTEKLNLTQTKMEDKLHPNNPARMLDITSPKLRTKRFTQNSQIGNQNSIFNSDLLKRQGLFLTPEQQQMLMLQQAAAIQQQQYLALQGNRLGGYDNFIRRRPYLEDYDDSDSDEFDEFDSEEFMSYPIRMGFMPPGLPGYPGNRYRNRR